MELWNSKLPKKEQMTASQLCTLITRNTSSAKEVSPEKTWQTNIAKPKDSKKLMMMLMLTLTKSSSTRPKAKDNYYLRTCQVKTLKQRNWLKKLKR